MRNPAIEKAAIFFRLHGYNLLTGLLAVTLFLQLVSWGYAYMELRTVDRLIVRAEDVTDTSGISGGGQEGNGNPEGSQPPDGGSNGQPAEEKSPARNVFKQETFPYQLTAIYMDTAVIDGQAVKSGDRVGKAVVQEISSSSVTILEEGQDNPRVITMFQSAGDAGNGRRGGGPRSAPRSRGNNRPSVSPGGPGGGSPPPGMPSTPEEFRAMRDRFANMSPEEREQMREQFRSSGGFGGRGFGGRGGGGGFGGRGGEGGGRGGDGGGRGGGGGGRD